VGTRDVFPRFNGLLREANFLVQANSNHLQNTIRMVALRQAEIKQRSI